MAVRDALDSGLGNVQRSNGPDVSARYQSLDTPASAFQSATGAAASQLEKGVNQAAESAFDIAKNDLRVQKEQDVIDATNLSEQYQREILQKTYDPQAGWLAQQGANAAGLADKVQKELETTRQRYASIVKNPNVGSLFNRSAQQFDGNTLEVVSRHQLTQQKAAIADASDSTVKLEAQKVALDYNNDAQFAKSLQVIGGAGLARGRSKGQDIATLNLEMHKDASSLYAARATQMMKSANPNDILAGSKFYRQAQKDGNLTLEDANTLYTLETGAVPRAVAGQAMTSLRAGGTNWGGLNPEQIWTGILQQESGGKRFGGPGSVAGPNELTTSPAGAKGEAQVLDSTNMNPGYGVTPAKDNSPDERARVGHDYFIALNNHYEDVNLAMLAYNWGPGNVDEHIAKYGDPRLGQITFNNFLATIPSAEARNYIPAVQQRLGFATNGKIDAGVAAAKAAEIDKEFPGSGETLITMVNKNNDIIDKGDADYKAIIKSRIAGQLGATNGDLSQVNPYDRGEAIRLGIWDDVSKYSGVTDKNTIVNLHAMPDEQFAATDLREYSDRLSSDDMQKMIDRQQKIKSGDEAYKTFTNASKNYWVRITGDNKESTDKANFQIRADQAFDTFRKQNQRGPNDDETRQILQKLTFATDTGGGFFGLSTTRGYQYQPADIYSVGGISNQPTIDSRTGIARNEIDSYSNALDGLGYDVTEENLKYIASEPKRLIGTIPGVPDDGLKPVVDQLVAKGLRLNPANIRIQYKILQARQQASIANQPTIAPQSAPIQKPVATQPSSATYSQSDIMYGD